MRRTYGADMTDLIALARARFRVDHPHYAHEVRFEIRAEPRRCVEVHRVDVPQDVPPITTYLIRERAGQTELLLADDE